jgi:hypothetical protein
VTSYERWIKELGYSEVPNAFLSGADPAPVDHPFFNELETIFARDDIGADSVLCLDSVPTVCIIDAKTLSQSQEERTSQIRRFCEKLWNQNLARIVLVAGEASIEAWAVDDPAAMREKISPEDRQILADFSIQGLLSGDVLRNRSAWFDPHKRVCRSLQKLKSAASEAHRASTNASACRIPKAKARRG